MTKIRSIDPNAVKASFDSIYVSDDPRAYYSVLGSLDYAIPDLARPIIRQIVSAWEKREGRAPTILDVGASYGVNAALLRYPLTFAMLRRRYCRREMMRLTPAQMRTFDGHYFKAWPRASAARLIGLDAAGVAVDYAHDVGLLDAAIAEDFESTTASGAAAHALEGVDIVMSTGCVGYVSEKTFDQILNAARRPPWVISFVLRMFDYEAISKTLAERGLATEKLASAAFLQRRFRDEREAGEVVEALHARGLDSAGLEADGMLFAELYLSRPEEAARAAALEDIVTVTSGRNMALGPRLIRANRGGETGLAPVR